MLQARALERAQRLAPFDELEKKRDEDGGVPPMRPLTLAADSKSDDKTCRHPPSDVAVVRSPSSVFCCPILRKEVIQPQVPLRLPCYDFTPVADPTVVACLLLG